MSKVWKILFEESQSLKKEKEVKKKKEGGAGRGRANAGWCGVKGSSGLSNRAFLIRHGLGFAGVTHYPDKDEYACKDTLK